MQGAMELFRVAAKLVLDNSGFNKDVADADKTGKGLAENLAGYMDKAKKALVALGLTKMVKEAASAAWNLAKQTSAAGDRIDKQSQALGLSRKAFQEWDYILAQSGASIDSMGVSMKTMQEAISSNSAEVASGLASLGLSAAHLQSLSPEEQFKELVRAFNEMPDGAEKTELAMKLFGKNAQSLMPLLNGTAESVEELRNRAHELGLIMSDDDVDASVAFGDALDDLNRVWTAVQQKFGAQMLPMLTKGLVSAANALGRVTTAVEKAFKDGDWSNVFKVLTEEIENLVPGLVDGIVNIATGIFDNADKLIDLAISIVNGLTSGLAKAMPKLAAKLPGILKSIAQGLLRSATDIGNAIIDTINGVFGINLPHLDEIKLPSLETIGKTISDWWDGGNGARKIIEDACKWVLNLFGVPTETAEQISQQVSEWFGGIVSFIVDACSWVLGLFGLPTNVDTNKLAQDVSTWFSGLSGILVDACNWILGLFGLPQVDAEKLKEDVGNWFDGIVGIIRGACDWVLGLFGVPTESDADIERLIDTWWSGVVGIITSACDWVLSLFGVPTETKEKISEIVGGWWTTVKDGVVTACTWVLSLFGFASNEDVSKHFSDWWSGADGEGGIKGLIKNIANWVLGALKLPDWDTIVQQITDWWNNEVLGHLRLSFEAVFGGVKGVQNAMGYDPDSDKGWGEQTMDNYNAWGFPTADLSNYDDDYWNDPNHAKGLNYVPYDGYRAILHRGETILNQDKARKYREGGSGFDMNQLYQTVASAVASAVADIQVNMDGAAVGNAVTQQVSRNLQRQQIARRFAAV